MDFSLQFHASFINRPIQDLPTPSLVLSKPTLERNIQQLLQDVKDLGISFRPHVKTLKVCPLSYLSLVNRMVTESLQNKSIEATRLMLGNGLHRKIVASTLAEIRGAIPLVKEGLLDEVCSSQSRFYF